MCVCVCVCESESLTCPYLSKACTSYTGNVDTNGNYFIMLSAYL